MNAHTRTVALAAAAALVAGLAPTSVASPPSGHKPAKERWQDRELGHAPDLMGISGRSEFVSSDSPDGFRFFVTSGGRLRTVMSADRTRTSDISAGPVGDVATSGDAVAWYDAGTSDVRIRAWTPYGEHGFGWMAQSENTLVPGSEGSPAGTAVAYDEARDNSGILARTRTGPGATSVLVRGTSVDPDFVPLVRFGSEATAWTGTDTVTDLVTTATKQGGLVAYRLSDASGGVRLVVRGATRSGDELAWGPESVLCTSAVATGCSNPQAGRDSGDVGHVFFVDGTLRSAPVAGQQVGPVVDLGAAPEKYVVSSSELYAYPPKYRIRWSELGVAALAGGTTLVWEMRPGRTPVRREASTPGATAIALGHSGPVQVLAWAAPDGVRAARPMGSGWLVNAVTPYRGQDQVGVVSADSPVVWSAGPSDGVRYMTYHQVDSEGPTVIFEGVDRLHAKGVRLRVDYVVEDHWGVRRSVIQVRTGAGRKSMGRWKPLRTVLHRGFPRTVKVAETFRARRGVRYCVRVRAVDRVGNTGPWGRLSADSSSVMTQTCFRPR